MKLIVVTYMPITTDLSFIKQRVAQEKLVVRKVNGEKQNLSCAIHRSEKSLSYLGKGKR